MMTRSLVQIPGLGWVNMALLSESEVFLQLPKSHFSDDRTAFYMTLNYCCRPYLLKRPQSFHKVLCRLLWKQTKRRKLKKKLLRPNHLRLKLIIHDIPQWLLIVSPCNCSETYSPLLHASRHRKQNESRIAFDSLWHCRCCRERGKFHIRVQKSFRVSARRAFKCSAKASAWLEFGHGNEMEHIKCQQEACSSCQGICGVKGALSLFRRVMLLTGQL